ncbi:hypothetical protein OHA25_60105 (plasmid) [Nonomuraea sp. NBC_00507]|uniref:hypothetical protein n=1 Tax=Nonomuraea sp. NBC_00507 TaxID=2976002 RepID=UPI002E17C8C8
MNDERHDTSSDEALCEVWKEMGAAERLLFPTVAGEQPPPEVSKRVREMYRERTSRPPTSGPPTSDQPTP